MQALVHIALSHFRLNSQRKWGLFIFLSVLSINYISINFSHSAQYWAKTYGGNGIDFSTSIQETSDEGYIVAGVTGSFSSVDGDGWIKKLDSNGGVTWQKTYGGSNLDEITSIKETTDGGYIVAGSTLSLSPSGTDAWILKLDSNGNIMWQKAYAGFDDDYPHSIQQTTDGGYIVAGATDVFSVSNDDAWILKLDSNGNIMWQKAYGRDNDEAFIAIQETTDEGYICAGFTNSFGTGEFDGWIMKLDRNGNVIWQKAYGGNGKDIFSSIQETTDGSYVVVGVTTSFGASNQDAWVINLDSNGTVVWQKTYDDSSFGLMTIQKTTDGGNVVAGSTGYTGRIIKLDNNGNITWQKTYGGDNLDAFFAIQETTDRGYVVAGVSRSFGSGDDDTFVLRLDSNGTIPYCEIMRNSNATLTDTSVSGQDTGATITNTSATIIDTTIIPVDSSARITTVCGDNAIPTLSEWGLIIFMTIVMGIGVVTILRRKMV